MGERIVRAVALAAACSMAAFARSRLISRTRSSAPAAWRFRSKLARSAARRCRASSRSWLFFSALMAASISFFSTSSSRCSTLFAACSRSLSSFTRRASCSARFLAICSTRSRYSAAFSNASFSWSCLSNSTSTSPRATWLPGAARRVMTSDSRPPPVWRGAADDVRPGGLGQAGDTQRPHELAGREGSGGESAEGRRSGAASLDGARRHTMKTAAASRHTATNGRRARPRRRRTPVGCPPASLPARIDMAIPRCWEV